MKKKKTTTHPPPRKKAKPGLRRLKKEKKKARIEIGPETKKSIWGIILLVIALIFILSFFNSAGRIGEYFLGASQFLFGKGNFLIPLILMIVAFIFFKSWKRSVYLSNLIGGILFTLSLLGILEVLGEKEWGGEVGFYLVYPFKLWLGNIASLIIFSALLIISILVLFNISLKKKRVEIQKPSYQVANIPVKKKPSIKKLAQKIFKLSKSEDSTLPVTQFKEPKVSVPQYVPSGGWLVPKPEEKKVEKEKPSFKPFPLDLLEKDTGKPFSGDTKENSNIIKKTLQNFGIEVQMCEVNIGPTVTQYTLKPAEGIKLSRITTLQNDLSLALASHPLRIEAPIPGRSLIGVEVPNRGRIPVRLKSLLENPNFSSSPSNLTFALGRDVAGNPVFADLKTMPHLLIAGSTGSGKTICINSIILSLLSRNDPEHLRFILVDPKRVEFPIYNGIPYLLSPVIVEIQKTVNALKWLIEEMERRFKLLSENKARDIEGYNLKHEPLPCLILIIDELADLMVARGREIEAGIVRLAQMARAVGIHLILATQRPSVEVITGLIKANITSRVAFQVASQIDSRTIIDMAGAEKLLGNGDMLYISSETAKPKRIQGAFVSEKEIKRVTDFIQNQGLEKPSQELEFKELIPDQVDLSELEEGMIDDEMYEEAKKVIIRARKASASLLQRHLRIGYARAARILDMMEEKGLVGPADGAKPREIYLNRVDDEFKEM